MSITSAKLGFIITMVMVLSTTITNGQPLLCIIRVKLRVGSTNNSSKNLSRKRSGFCTNNANTSSNSETFGANLGHRCMTTLHPRALLLCYHSVTTTRQTHLPHTAARPPGAAQGRRLLLSPVSLTSLTVPVRTHSHHHLRFHQPTFQRICQAPPSCAQLDSHAQSPPHQTFSYSGLLLVREIHLIHPTRRNQHALILPLTITPTNATTTSTRRVPNTNATPTLSTRS